MSRRFPQVRGVVCPGCGHIHNVRDDVDFISFKCNLCGYEWDAPERTLGEHMLRCHGPIHGVVYPEVQTSEETGDKKQ